MSDAKSAAIGDPIVTFGMSFVVRGGGGGGGRKEGFFSNGGSFGGCLDIGLGGLPPLASGVAELAWDDESNDRLVDQDTLRPDAMAGLSLLCNEY
jgi:hypothetical protein